MLRRAAALAILALAIVALDATTARSDTETERYGGEILGTEAVGWTTVAAGSRFDFKPVLYGGFVVLALGSPAIHALHDNFTEAGISFGLHLGMPTLLGYLGSKIDPCRGDSCTPVGIIAGVVGGYLGALAIDVVFLAKTENENMPVPRMITIGGSF